MPVDIKGLPTQLTKSQCDQLRKQLIQLQGGRCALCESRFQDIKCSPCLDHDHKTGLVRGVLCTNCNGMEGKIFNRANRAKRKKSIQEWMRGLLDYWKYHQENPSKYIYYMHGKSTKRKVTEPKRRKKI